MGEALQAPPGKVLESVQKLKDEVATLRKVQAEASKQGLEAEFAELAAGARSAPGGRWVVAPDRLIRYSWRSRVVTLSPAA